jgi:hypothetical protein
MHGEAEPNRVHRENSVFGVDPDTLSTLLTPEGVQVPACLALLRKGLFSQHGIDVPGIFSRPGNAVKMKKIEEELNAMTFPVGDFSRYDAHDLANVIKVSGLSFPVATCVFVQTSLRVCTFENDSNCKLPCFLINLFVD